MGATDFYLPPLSSAVCYSAQAAGSRLVIWRATTQGGPLNRREKHHGNQAQTKAETD